MSRNRITQPLRAATIGVVTLLMAALLAACGGDTGANSDEILVGTTLPLTSPLSAEAESIRDGYQMAIDEINTEGGIDGRQIKLLVEDDRADPALAKQLTSKLIAQEGVVAILGSFGSAASLTQSAETERHGIPGIYPEASVEEMVTRGYENVFNLYPLSAQAERSMDEFLLAEVKPQKVAIMYVDNPFAIAGAEASKKSLEAAGVKVAVFEKYAIDSDALGPVSKAKRAGVDVIKNIGYATNYTSYMQALKQTDLNVKAAVFLTQIPFDHRWIKTVGPKVANGIIGNPYWYKGATPEFEAAYEQKWNRPAVLESILGYTSVQVLADAIERANTTEKDALRAALKKTDLETVYGKVSFDERGAYSPKIVVGQLVDGKVVTLWPQDAANGTWKPWVQQSKR